MLKFESPSGYGYTLTTDQNGRFELLGNGVTEEISMGVAVIMFGLGLSLTIDDFKRVARYPFAVGFGLFLQVVLLPFAAAFIAIVLKLRPELALGLMLVSVGLPFWFFNKKGWLR